MVDNNKKNLLILIHGFKKNNENIFSYFQKFVEENSEQVDFDIYNFQYYDNLNKETISNKKMKIKIKEVLEQHKDRNVFLLGYSMGGLASLSLSHEYKNITKIFALVPVLKINNFFWFKKIIQNYTKMFKLKKKLGKERYKRIKELKSKGNSEKYPIKIIIEINLFRKKNIKNIKLLENKDIHILFSNNDEINNLKKTISYFNDKINYKENYIKINFTTLTHFQLLDKENTEIFQEILNFFKYQ